MSPLILGGHMPASTMPLRIEPIAGPPLRAAHVQPGGPPITLGRKGDCNIILADSEGVVSRYHAKLTCETAPNSPPVWRLEDLESKHGTFVNGNRLTPGFPTPLEDGDRVRIGPWTLRIATGATSATTHIANTDDDRFTGMSLVRKLPAAPLAPDAHRKLELLMSAAASIGAAQSEQEIAETAAEALIAGCGLPRAAFLRSVGTGESVEVVASKGAGFTGSNSRFSRTLIQAASEGQTVVLNTTDTPNYGQSVMSLGISAAVCSPIMIDGAPDSFLYMDVRGRDASTHAIGNETAAFCQAIAKLCALGLSNLHRVRLAEDQQRRRTELEAARDVQRIIMPPPAGSHGGVSYFMHSSPGRFVAGDLFDFFPIDDSRAGVLLGDVVGKGIAAGMLMANVQAHLHRLLRQTADPAAALNETTRLVAQYSDRHAGRSTLFLSLWAGVLDVRAGVLTFIDAGHGYATVRPSGGPPVHLDSSGGPPLGVDGTYRYANETIALTPGFRIAIFSDGLAEQTSPTGEQFGRDRVLPVLAGAATPADQVRQLLAEITSHAGAHKEGPESPFSDDVTIAIIDVG